MIYNIPDLIINSDSVHAFNNTILKAELKTNKEPSIFI